jgi:hypothetical protein
VGPIALLDVAEKIKSLGPVEDRTHAFQPVATPTELNQVQYGTSKFGGRRLGNGLQWRAKTTNP